MAKKSVHLLCNAHLDPVWLWEWKEGAAEALKSMGVEFMPLLTIEDLGLHP